jgi:inner membrane protein
VFIGHLPAGYLVTDAFLSRTPATGPARRRLLALGLAASVAPDIDLLYFYLVSDRREVHHTFFPHLPLVWFGALAGSAVFLVLRRSSPIAWLALAVVGLNVMLHLVLDTVAGGVRWAWPWSVAEARWVEVPARYHPWYVNFLLHWTFALELVLVTAAGWLSLRRRRRPQPTAPRFGELQR